ncbi:hypothetical protein GUITHDRAFT_104476 [Guillardia theta CCMP2712]|uniref:RRM domain-containing protein n=1 Tax=Guillardia theta (strain CCMP2712) TaxID=905079 RepID=L1JNP1_GUITC|nr:hypothetical protein GUITHDRAFT_104476 [Guillardia theta CCMP2712]EKX50082.1 hypothetical protein GUITHDRAFT_104476 [Guillardia theta CCMP2712]|eukprot:XP_005837062.1 hypothetical protein GUITHDRAFT_104476 [Guillardia theta CCMP2712]
MVLQLDVGINKEDSNKLPAIDDFFGSYGKHASNLDVERQHNSPRQTERTKRKAVLEPDAQKDKRTKTKTAAKASSKLDKKIEAKESQEDEEEEEQETGVDADSRESDGNEEEALERTLFVGGVPLASTRKSIKKFFQEFGFIESVRMRSIPISNPKLPKKTSIALGMVNSERETCNAYVRFKEKGSVAKALSKNGSLMEGHRIKVDHANISKNYNVRLSVFVGNLPFNAGKRFHKHGFGYVTFTNAEEVQLALKKHEAKFEGRALRVVRAAKRPAQTETSKEDSGKFSGAKRRLLEKGKQLDEIDKGKSSKKARTVPQFKAPKPKGGIVKGGKKRMRAKKAQQAAQKAAKKMTKKRKT